MSSRDIGKVLRASGRLSIDPTDGDLSGTFPYGGTALGYSIEVSKRIQTDHFAVLAEEYGGAVVEMLERGEYHLCAGFFSAWDPDVLSTLFPNTRTGSRQNSPILQHQHNGTRRAGMRLSDRSVKLVFTPDDWHRAPAWILYRAMPLVDVARRMGYDRDEELGVPFVFAALPDTTTDRNVGEDGFMLDLQVAP